MLSKKKIACKKITLDMQYSIEPHGQDLRRQVKGQKQRLFVEEFHYSSISSYTQWAQIALNWTQEKINQNFQMFLNIFKNNYQIALEFIKRILQTK